MSNTKLTVLGIVAFLTVALAIFQSQLANEAPTESTGPSYLIQGLDPGNIGSVVLGKGDDAVTLKRDGNRFVVTGKDNYPAQIDSINDLITTCLDVRTSQLYTTDAGNHGDLGVTEDAAEEIVKFYRSDGTLLTGLILGKSKERDKGSYVRLASGDNVYLTLDRPYIRSGAMDYIDSEIVTVNTADIVSVSAKSGTDKYTIKPGDDSGDVILQDLAEGKKAKQDQCRKVLNAPARINFEDVKNASGFGDVAFDKKFICRLKDSTVYTLAIARKDDKFYLKCIANFTDKTPVKMEKGVVESEEQLKKKEAKLKARDAVKLFNDRHKGWVYEIPSYVATNLTMTKSELTEDIEKKEDTAPDKAEEPAQK